MVTKKTKSKTQQAVDMVDAGKATPYAASKAMKISHNAVYRALRNRKFATDGLCPCCGQSVRPACDPKAEVPAIQKPIATPITGVPPARMVKSMKATF